MASLKQLVNLGRDIDTNAFIKRVRVALAIKVAELINNSTRSEAQTAFVKDAVDNSKKVGQDIATHVVADNADLSASKILGASDDLIQTSVNKIVDALTSAPA